MDDVEGAAGKVRSSVPSKARRAGPNGIPRNSSSLENSASFAVKGERLVCRIGLRAGGLATADTTFKCGVKLDLMEGGPNQGGLVVFHPIISLLSVAVCDEEAEKKARIAINESTFHFRGSGDKELRLPRR